MAIALAGPLCIAFAQTAAAEGFVAGVLQWQRDLRESLAGRPLLPLPWREDAAGPAVAVDLGGAGLQAVRLFALYAERSDLELPDTVPPLLELDKHWRAAADAAFGNTNYAHVLVPRVWLPGDFPFTFKAPLPDGEAAEFGAVDGLVRQLRWLDQRTFQGDAGQHAQWLELPAEPGGELVTAARRGLAGLLAASLFAQAHAAPVFVHC